MVNCEDMKKVLTIIAAVAALVACSKVETPAQKEEINDVTPGKKMVLFAEVPEMTAEDGTKAIADDGPFSWSEGDEIAIPLKTDYAVFVYRAENKQFEYTLTGTEEFVAGTAYYPASSRPGGSYSTSFDDASAARAGFKMEASYTLGASSLSFTHKSALISLNFTNVPSFATSVVVKKGGATEATVALSSPSSTVSLKVPVTPAASTNYSFALMEGSNIIREVGKTVTINAGTCYSTPDIAINKYIVLSNADKNATYKLGLQIRTGESYIGYSGDYNTNYDLVSYNNGTSLYIILPDDFSSAKAIKVVLRKNGDTCTSATERIFLDRNPSFNISEDSMKTAYRVYYGGSTNTNVYQYYQPLLYLKDEIWGGNVMLHYWCGDDNIGTYCFNDYCGKIDTEGDYSVFKVKPSLAGKTVGVQFINPGNHDDKFETSMTLYTGKTYGGAWWNKDGNGYYSISGSFNFEHTDSEWPGEPPSTGSTTNLPYIEFDQSLYGNSQFNVIFNNGSSGYGNQSSTWSGTLDEDGYFAS